VNTQLATELEVGSRRSARALAVTALGPLTALVGLGWAIFQPYRITLLHPSEHGFWSLAVEPPLLVILVGLVFHLLITPGLVRDLADLEEP
jgi:hypothetical protein